MPGKKDFVSVKQGDHRVHIQKRLVLSNLKEAYQLFKNKYSNEKVGLQNFDLATVFWLEPAVPTQFVFVQSTKMSN